MSTGVPLGARYPIALPAVPVSLFGVHGVFWRERVPVDAYCSVRIDGGRAETAEVVFARSDRFKVVGVHAMAYPAKMVNVDSLGRERPVRQEIRESMSEDFLAMSRRELSIATPHHRALPSPAPVRVFAHSWPELLFRGWPFYKGDFTPPPASLITGIAQSPRPDSLPAFSHSTRLHTSSVAGMANRGNCI